MVPFRRLRRTAPGLPEFRDFDCSHGPAAARATSPKPLPANGALIKIYDPNRLVPRAGWFAAADAVRREYDSIEPLRPGGREDSQFYPAAEYRRNALTGQNNYLFCSKSITNSDKYDFGPTRISPKARGSSALLAAGGFTAFPGQHAAADRRRPETTDHYTQGVADLTHVFSPATVADLQFSVSRALATQYGVSQGFDVSSLGFPAAFKPGGLAISVFTIERRGGHMPTRRR